jgi:MFS family permease
VPSSAVPTPAHDSAAVTRAAVNLLAIACFFSGAALRICDGLLPRLAGDFTVTPGTAGQVILAFAMAYGFSQLAYGTLGDRYGKARIVCIALFASAAGALACTMAPDLDVLVRLRILWGAVAGGVIPMSMAWIGDNVPYEAAPGHPRALLLGTLSGMTAGQLAGGLFADSDWAGAAPSARMCAGYLVVAAAAGAPAHIPRTRSRRRRGAPGSRDRRGAAHALGARRARAVMAEGIFLLGPLAFLPAYLHQRFGLALSVASGFVALYAVGGVLYAMAARHIVRRFGERRMVLWGGILMGAGFLAWYLIPQGLDRRADRAGGGLRHLPVPQHPADARNADGADHARHRHVAVRLQLLRRPGDRGLAGRPVVRSAGPRRRCCWCRRWCCRSRAGPSRGRSSAGRRPDVR